MQTNVFFRTTWIFAFLAFICVGFNNRLNARDSYPDFITVAKNSIPAVVSIQVKSQPKSQRNFYFNGSPFEGDSSDVFGNDFWNRFFGMPTIPQQQQAHVGQASGFIVTADGYIITNSHVVNDATEIKVLMNDGREFAGKLVGQDPSTDVAVVKIEADHLPFLKFGNSENLEVGQWVAAVGSPLGLQATITTGIISAKGRNNLDIVRIEDFIQTDTPINRGNSGGPLLNLDSQVIGMNTAIATSNATGGYMGIGFAIPSTIIQHVMDQIIATGNVTRGFIGVSLQNVDSDLAAAFGMAKPDGALIANIEKNSPAEKAGLEQGDIILKYNNLSVTNIGTFRNAVSLMTPGSKINLSVLRKGQTLNVPVEVGSYPVASAASPQPDTKLGFDVENILPEVAKKFGIATEEKGVVITKVEPGSAAEWAGLRQGAVILAVNQKKIASVDEFKQEVANTPKERPPLFLVKQGNIIRYISIKVG